MKNSGSEIAASETIADELVGQAVAVLHRDHPEQDRQRHRDQRGEEGEEQRVAEPVGDLLADRVAAGPGGAEVALRHAAEPRDVALGPRPVEPELGADVGHRLGRRRLAEVGRGEVARQRLDAAEDQQRHRQQQAERQAETAQDQPEQRPAPGRRRRLRHDRAAVRPGGHQPASQTREAT